LTGAGYLDDLAFARTWVTGRASSRPCGVQLLRRELREKGVASAIVEQAIREAYGGDELSVSEERYARAVAAPARAVLLCSASVYRLSASPALPAARKASPLARSSRPSASFSFRLAVRLRLSSPPPSSSFQLDRSNACRAHWVRASARTGNGKQK
jgi:hypothetical protein